MNVSVAKGTRPPPSGRRGPPQRRAKRPPPPRFEREVFLSRAEIQAIVRKFIKRTDFKYSFNKKLNQLVVEVFDADTGKLVRVLPPEEIQRVRESVQEVLGLLFDAVV